MTRTRALHLLSVAALVAAAGCATDQSVHADAGTVNSGLASLEHSTPQPPRLPDPSIAAADDARLLELAQKSALDWEAVMRASRAGSEPAATDAMTFPSTGLAAVRRDAQPATPDEPWHRDLSIEPAMAIASRTLDGWSRLASRILAAYQPPATSAAPVDERVARLAAELRIAIAQRAAMNPSPLRDYVALVAIGAPGEGPASTRLRAIDPDLDQKLTPTEIAAIDAIGRVADQLAAAESDDAVEALFTHAADLVAQTRPFRISAAALCSSVVNFGIYDELPGSTFLVGRPVRAILYTEIDHFAARRESPNALRSNDPSAAETWTVEVSQELRLYHADGTLAWYMPEQTSRDTSRNRRRDYFLTNRVELPATLSVGTYALKVVMRDKITGAVDERILPLTIVADASLTRAE